MKGLKILANICGVCFLCVGILLYVIHDTSRNIVTGEVVDQISAQMNNMLLSSLDSLNVDNSLIEKAEQYLPQGIKDEIANHHVDGIDDKIDEIKAELANSDELKAISDTYMTAVLDGVIDGNVEMPDIDQDLKELSKEYIPKVSSAIQIPISEEQAEQISDRLISKVNLQDSVSKLVNNVHMHLSDQQIQVFNLIRIIQTESIQWLALGCLVIGFFLIIIGTQSAVKWTWYVGTAAILCGLLMWVGCQMLQWMLQSQLQDFQEIILSFSDGLIDTVKLKGTALCVFGFGCFGSYGILYQLKKYVKRQS